MTDANMTIEGTSTRGCIATLNQSTKVFISPHKKGIENNTMAFVGLMSAIIPKHKAK